MKNRVPAAVAIIFFLGFFVSCSRCATEKEEKASPTPVEFIEDLPEREFVSASRGDTVILQVFIFVSRNFELDGSEPVQIYPPGNSVFRFEERIYRQNPATRVFPVEIPFELTSETPPGDHILRLGMRVFYTDKADNRSHVRTEVIKVPVRVSPRRDRSTREIRFPMEYMLE